MTENLSNVYVKVNSSNYITEVNSSIFVSDPTGWLQIDSGTGDKFAHAQGNYFSKPLIDSNGRYNYRYDSTNKKVVERTDTEKQSDTSYINSIYSSKSSELDALCDSEITSGIDCDPFSTGTNLHYSLPQLSREKLESLWTDVKSGTTSVLWHDDSRIMHQTYTSAQFTILYKAVKNYIYSCLIRCDGLKQYLSDTLKGTDTNKISTAQAINWSTTLPTALQTEVDSQISATKMT
jgi:hypothetical protein